MAEFVALVAAGMLVVGLGVLAACSVLTAAGWLVVRLVRHGGPPRPGGAGGPDG
ncbi:hypothetical protein GCM10027451_05300 [Geodermatophilus aquaeductus]|uniref:Uncharacterized protein n=1 Tax=Geodermatophilus aquaeductus TaxID=1564161 RepID=A0A521C4Z1_9ACTN|nr:hypothetical protein [Geodermatophilus aquaeductus]SMO54492.1 hypothetical protein SAMN06273567_102145 [Geodermatophilus aquaeductus]